MKRAVIVVASGRGTRAGTKAPPKQFVSIGGKPLLAYTLAPFMADERIDLVQVVIHGEHHGYFEECVHHLPNRDKLLSPIHGGDTRQVSVRHGLEALREQDPDYVFIHDGVRPFVSSRLLDRLIARASGDACLLPAVSVRGTLKQVEDEVIVKTLPRSGVHEAQTPQVFPYRAILEAHQTAVAAGRDEFTDDASIMEWAGHTVEIVPGEDLNIKVTYPTDFTVVKALLASRETRVGQGYDVHRFKPGDHVMLCGVRIPHDFALDGHSDADVALHAVTDALLGAIGAGDIGQHFPPSDETWRNASSETFVRFALQQVQAVGGEIGNVDLAILAEAPRIGPRREEMQRNLARLLDISPDRVGVKATTNERLGFIGRREGIAALATASVRLPLDDTSFSD